MTSVLVISDVRLYREGLAAMLAADASVQVIGTAASPDDASHRTPKLEPDVVLLDVALPEVPCSVRMLGERFPDTNVVVLGVSETRSEIVACAEAGVAGYVCRESGLQDLISVVKSSARGELRCSDRVARALLQRVATLAAGRLPRLGDVHFTAREIEVSQLLDEGLTNQEIAARLGIQIATVKVHVHNILEKLGLHNRGAAVALLRRSGLIRSVGHRTETPPRPSGERVPDSGLKPDR